MWDGSKGQTVVVQCDQGLGDQIMFAQCLPQLIADSKQVIIECSPRMAGLCGRNLPQALIQPTLKQPKLEWPKDYPIDAHVHVSAGWASWYRATEQRLPPAGVHRRRIRSGWRSGGSGWRSTRSRGSASHGAAASRPR